MVHANTERFIGDWRARRGAQRLPHRRDLDPTLFGRLAPQLFMLGADGEGRERFRLAGGLLIDLHGRELAGTAFANLWASAERLVVEQAIARARRACAPVVLQARAAPACAPGVQPADVAVEMTLCPLVGPSGRVDRTFGLYQPVAPLAGLLGRVVREHALDGFTLAEERPAAALRLVALDGRRVA